MNLGWKWDIFPIPHFKTNQNRASKIIPKPNDWLDFRGLTACCFQPEKQNGKGQGAARCWIGNALEKLKPYPKQSGDIVPKSLSKVDWRRLAF